MRSWCLWNRRRFYRLARRTYARADILQPSTSGLPGALLATLLPDPGDPRKRQETLKTIGGDVKVEHGETKDDDGNIVVEEGPILDDGVLAWNAEDSEFLANPRRAIRKATGNAGESPVLLEDGERE